MQRFLHLTATPPIIFHARNKLFFYLLAAFLSYARMISLGLRFLSSVCSVPCLQRMFFWILCYCSGIVGFAWEESDAIFFRDGFVLMF